MSELTKEAMPGLEDLKAMYNNIDPRLPKYIIPSIAGGLAAGGMGFLGSRRGKERPGEDRAERRWRILRNTLGMGAAGAAAAPALVYAGNRMMHMAPEHNILERALDDAGPIGLGLTGATVGAAGGGMIPRYEKVKNVVHGMPTHTKLPFGPSLPGRLRNAGGVGLAGAVLGIALPGAVGMGEGVLDGNLVSGGVGAGLGYTAAAAGMAHPKLYNNTSKLPAWAKALILGGSATSGAGTGIGIRNILDATKQDYSPF